MKRFTAPIGALFFLVGFLYLLGTAGASDCGMLSLGQIYRQGAISLALVGIGVLLLHKSEHF